VLWGGFHNMSFSHTDTDIQFTLNAYEQVFPILKEAVQSGKPESYLQGVVLEMVFRKTKY
jgi:glutamate-1-semialdehyde 2,1-aminomutase